MCKCSCIDGFLERNRNTIDDESVYVGDNPWIEEVKLLVVETLDCRESLVHDAGDCLVLGGIDLELHHAFTSCNSVVKQAVQRAPKMRTTPIQLGIELASVKLDYNLQ